MAKSVSSAREAPDLALDVARARGASWPLFIAVVAALVVGVVVEVLATLYQRLEARSGQLEAVALGDQVRSRLERELNTVLFLTAGLRSYLSVRGDVADEDELQVLLGDGYTSSRHVRNFGIAKGTVIRNVYPLAGNEAVIGTDYRDLPDQWPEVQMAIDRARPVLSPMVTLVQGGQSFIYRVPVFRDDQFWGLISAVVDAQSLFSAAFAGLGGNGYQFAIAEQGRGHGPMWGVPSVLDQPDAVVVHPARGWVIALRTAQGHDRVGAVLAVRLMGWALAVIVGALAYALARRVLAVQRTTIYDELTGLPNRRLLLERVARCLERRDAQCALLYCDIDDFYRVKERLGERAGEAVLREVARRLRGAVGPHQALGRWGNDEFVVLGPVEAPGACEALESAIRDALGSVVMYRGTPVHVSLSIGLAQAPGDGQSPRDLIDCAEDRMRRSRDKRAAGLRAAPA